jgi:hypothetical protein
VALTDGPEGVVVEVALDSEEFRRGLKTLDRGVSRFDERLKRLSDGVVRFGTAATAAFGAFAVLTIRAAAQAEGASRKFAAVFGQTAGDVEKWANRLAEAFQVNRTAMLGFLAQAQDLFVPMGMAREEAAELAKRVVELSTKLSVFNAQPTELTLSNIMSGLVGITRTVRQYGILLNEERVAQEAVNAGYARTTKEVSEQAKVLARLNIMYADSRDAVSKAQSLMGGLVGETRKVTKVLEEFREDVGEALLPFLKDINETILPIIEGWGRWAKENEELITTLTKLVPHVAAITVATKALAAVGLGRTGVLGGGIFYGAFRAGRAIRRWMEGGAEEEARIEQMRKRAEEVEEETNEKLRKLFEERAKRWAATIGGAFEEGFEAAAKATMDAIEGPHAQRWLDEWSKRLEKATTAGELKGLENAFQEVVNSPVLLRSNREIFRQVLDLADDMTTKWMRLESEAMAETQRARVKAMADAMKQQEKLVRDTLERELSLVKHMMRRAQRARDDALRRAAEARQKVLELELRGETVGFRLGQRRPGATEGERFAAELREVVRLRERAEELFSWEEFEAGNRLLERAASLAEGLARGFELSGEDAKKFHAELSKIMSEIEDPELKRALDMLRAGMGVGRGVGEEGVFRGAAETARVLLEGIMGRQRELAEEAAEEFERTAEAMRAKMEDLKAAATAFGETAKKRWLEAATDFQAELSHIQQMLVDLGKTKVKVKFQPNEQEFMRAVRKMVERAKTEIRRELEDVARDMVVAERDVEKRGF